VLLHRLANRISGPSDEQLRTGRSRLWGEVRNAAGERRTAHLETGNGYRLTADGTMPVHVSRVGVTAVVVEQKPVAPALPVTPVKLALAEFC
jgi:short subunit dehydrogenase-like uncharacterized protein